MVPASSNRDPADAGPAAPAGEPQPEVRPAWRRQAAFSLVLAIAILFALGLHLDLDAVWKELKGCDKTFVLLALLAHYATYPLRGIRWQRALDHLHPRASSARFGLLVFFYTFVDNVVPAMLGQVYGAHLAHVNTGVRRSAAMGSIVFLRMIDAWVVLGVGAVASWLVFSQALPDSVAQTLLLGGVVAVVASLALVTILALHKAHRAGPLRLPESLRRRLDGFRTGMWPDRRHFVSIVFLTALIWTLEVAWMAGLARAFDVSLGLGELLFVTMVPLLASAFPLTPSGAGVVDWTILGCLRAVGVGAVAEPLTVLNRVIDYWLHVFLGLVLWALRGRLGLRTWRADEGKKEPAGSEPLALSVRESAT